MNASSMNVNFMLIVDKCIKLHITLRDIFFRKGLQKLMIYYKLISIKYIYVIILMVIVLLY